MTRNPIGGYHANRLKDPKKTYNPQYSRAVDKDAMDAAKQFKAPSKEEARRLVEWGKNKGLIW